MCKSNRLPSLQQYDQQKAALVGRTAASQRTQLQQLLSSEELSDRWLSQLLRLMRQLLGEQTDTIDDALLHELFLQRLPASVQMALATASFLDVNSLATLADQLMEVSSSSVSGMAAAVSATVKPSERPTVPL